MIVCAFVVLLVVGLAGRLSLTSVRAAGIISGSVFHDYNGNGLRDPSQNVPNLGGGTVTTAADTGRAGVLVTAYDAAGAVAGSATTATDGTYTINAISTGPYRVEFSNLGSGFQPSPASAESNTTVQFVPDAGGINIDLGILRPGEYCQTNPDLALPCYVFGDQVTGPHSAAPVLINFPYTSGSNTPGGDAANVATYDQPTAHSLMLPASAIGTTWGLSWSPTRERLFASAFFKRHHGFGPGADTTINTADDPGTVYVIDPAANSVVARFVVPNATTNGHDTTNYVRDNDNVGWDSVGKTSLGGMALSDDESRLYVMNLEDRQVYALDPDTGTVLANNSVPLNPPGCPAASDVRPFDVSFYQGRVYIGMVCSAESSQNVNDLIGYVYSGDPATLAFSAAPVLQFPLNYPRQFASIPDSASAAWRPWSPIYNSVLGLTNIVMIYPQPILADIVFDNGNMIIGLRDRAGDQASAGEQSNPNRPTDNIIGVGVGDVLRACGDPGSGWTLESNGRCGGAGTAPQNTNQGPGGGEFYFNDNYPGFHDDVGMGGLTQLPGYPDVVATMFDPILIRPPDLLFDAGVRWMNNTNGTYSKAYRVFDGDVFAPDFAGKANGLGDLEVLCQAAPIEIGNRVWFDENRNGVQDPDEPSLPGVQVQLFDPAGLGGPDGIVGTADDILGPDGIPGTADDGVIAIATTDANGNYYFSNGSNGTTTGSALYGLPLLFNRNYQTRIDMTQPAITTPGYTLTVGNTGSGTTADLNDSDGVLTGNFAVASFSTGGPGQNNHSYDFGFFIDTTAIVLSYFAALQGSDGVQVVWETSAEIDTRGFHLLRSATSSRADAERVTSELILARGSGRGGARYSFVDATAAPGTRYTYWLVEYEQSGAVLIYGPTSSQATTTEPWWRTFFPWLQQ
jgi:hypothetical protein